MLDYSDSLVLIELYSDDLFDQFVLFLKQKFYSPPCILSEKESIFNAILFFTEIHLFVRYVEKKLIITQETFITSVVSTIAVTLASLP